ncbi:MAG: Fur family transcriptional regulator [Actinomycetales bacterium]
MTAPRLAVLEAVASLGGHPTAEVIAGEVEADGVHRATVYRTLEALTEAGLISHVHLDSGVTAYHRADSHLHARCHECGAVVDLPADLLDAAADRVRQLNGFVLDAGHMALSGTCHNCGGAASHDK